MEEHQIDEDYMGDGSKESVPMKPLNPDGTQAKRLSKRDSKRASQSESTEPKKASCSEIMADPFGHLTLVGFATCGCLGLVFACIAFANVEVGFYVSACLFITGFYSAYEIRMLAVLKKELNELEDVQKTLEEQVERLDEQVDVYDQQNKEFKTQTDDLQEANEKFETEIQDLEAVAEDLTRTKDEFEAHNGDLDVQLEKLDSANTSLKGSLESLKQQTDGLENQLEQFEELQKAIGKYAEKNNTDMSEALAKQTEMFNTLKTLMSDNAQTLLNQVATDIEYFDDEEGMTEGEFNKWLDRIPARFRQQLQEKGFTFAEFAGIDGDNIMDFKEMGKLIEDLLSKDGAN